jgi:hypothetical protein
MNRILSGVPAQRPEAVPSTPELTKHIKSEIVRFTKISPASGIEA